MVGYHFGDLCEYTRVISNPIKFKKYDKFNKEQKDNLFKEIVQLVELAKQIAQGFVISLRIFYIFFYRF